MKDQLISFETAKLAKQKGIIFKNLFSFNHTCYHKDGTIKNSDAFKTIEKIQSNIPTQSLLQKWLRDVHNIQVTIEFWNAASYNHKWKIQYKSTKPIINQTIFGTYCENYEEALESGLQEALKLI